MSGARDYLVVGIRNSSAWAVIGFCVLRSLEVLFFERPLSFTPMAVAISSVMFAVVVYLRTFGNPYFRWGSNQFLACLTVAWLTVAVLAQLAFTQGAVDQNGVDSHVYLVKVTIAMLMWFLAGAGSCTYEETSSGKGYIFLMLGLFLLVLKATDLGFFIPYGSLSGYADLEAMNHLLLAEYMLIICFFGYCAAEPRGRILFFVVVAYILFAGGGRASFSIGVLSLIGYEFIFGFRRVGFSVICIAIFAVFSVFVFADQTVIARMFVTEGLGADASFGGRFEQLLVGIEGLWRQMIWGDISFFVVQLGGVGNYIHNFLSAWQFYGVVGFLLYIVLAAKAVFGMLFVASTGSSRYLDRVFSALLIYSILSVLFVKAVVFSTFWLSIGYWIFRFSNFKPSARTAPL